MGGGGIDQAGLSCFFISAELTRELRTHNTHQESKSRQRRCFVIMREKPGQWFPSPQEARRPGLAGGARCQLERQANTERDGMTSRWRCFFLGGGGYTLCASGSWGVEVKRNIESLDHSKLITQSPAAETLGTLGR